MFALLSALVALPLAYGASGADTLTTPAFVRDVVLQQNDSCKIPNIQNNQGASPAASVTKDFLSAQERDRFQGLATIPTAHKNRFRGKVSLPPFLKDRILQVTGIPKAAATKDDGKLVVQTNLITGTTPRHVDCMMPDEQGDHMQAMKGEDKTMFVFLNTNEQAVFVVDDTEVPVQAGTMVQFPGSRPHHTILKNNQEQQGPGAGVVELLGPFNAATFQRVEMGAPVLLAAILEFLFLIFKIPRRLLSNDFQAVIGGGGGCYLPENNNNGLVEQVNPAQFRSLFGHLENKEDFSTDELLSIYLSYLSEEEANDAIASIDTNQDGIIDQNELENMSIPDDIVEFIFTDVLACAASDQSSGSSSSSSDAAGGKKDDCMTAQAAIDFLNAMFDHEVVDAELAAHIKESSGADSCFTREEFRSYASPGSDSKLEEEEQSKNGSSAPFFGMHLALLFFCLATSAAAVLFGL